MAFTRGLPLSVAVRAGAKLAAGKEKVIDIALRYGYDSPDSFAKAFQKFHGITPSEARKSGAKLKSFSPPVHQSHFGRRQHYELSH